ncbi:hypothetical protein AB0M43_32235 [Longispora sp. NPDC051575]|uniref:hypothetical protein n=1 Tax=Longispora sp. NPDC051575 TaxID=3154943 RepID=UPI00341E3958
MTDDVFTVDSLRGVALAQGWSYRENDQGFADRWGGPPFDTWSGSKRAADVVSGEYRERPVVAFCLLTGDENFLVVATSLPGRLPRFALAPPVGAVDPGPFGYGFEAEDPDLAQKYEVYAADADLAAAVLHVDAVAMLRKHRSMDWRIEGRDLLAIERMDREVSEDELLGTLDALVTIAVGIPSGLFDRYPTPTPYPAV